jgi:hypothetical protein
VGHCRHGAMEDPRSRVWNEAVLESGVLGVSRAQPAPQVRDIFDKLKFPIRSSRASS